MLKIEFRAMGCQMTALLDNESAAAARALEQVPVWFEEWEQALSRFRHDSELNHLNASAGRSFETGPVLWEVIRASLEAAEWTDGLVSPTVLHALERAGYDRSFELLQTAAPGPIRSLQAPSDLQVSADGWHEIGMEEGCRTVTLPYGIKLDLGGIGKGWAAWQAMQGLSKYGPALVDAAGDIAVSDVQSDGSPWPIAIADPLHVQENLGLLALGGCGVATSGIDYRRWRKDGAWKHHIIDPRTGEPAETDLMTVTVIAPNTLQAEAAAKAVLIQGSQAGLAWLEAQPELAGLLALQDGQLLYSRGVHNYFWS